MDSPGPGVEGFAVEFEGVTGMALPSRRANRLEDRVLRQDPLFPILAGWAFDHPEAVPALRDRARGWADRWDDCATWEIYGYLSYLVEDWREAAQAFMRSLDGDPENLDAWLDLAFSLKHLGVSLGESILFDHEEFIRAWREESPARCDLFALRALEGRIRREGRSYERVFHRWMEPYRSAFLQGSEPAMEPEGREGREDRQNRECRECQEGREDR